MDPKFALFEFVNEDNAVEIGEATRIIIKGRTKLSNNTWDINAIHEVKWPGKNGKMEIVAAKVLRFSDDRPTLTNIMDRLLDGEDLDDILTTLGDLGRGKRGKRVAKHATLSSDDEESETQVRRPTKKTKVSSEKRSEKELLSILKERSRAKEGSETSHDGKTAPIDELREEVASLRQAVKDLQESNASLIAINDSLVKTVNSLSGLPYLVEKLTTVLEGEGRNSTTSWPWGHLQPKPRERSVASRPPPLPRSHEMPHPPASPTPPSAPPSANRIVPPAPVSESLPTVAEIDTASTSSDVTVSDQTVEASTSNSFTILPELLTRIAKTDARKMTNELLQGLYGEEYLASHSVTGGTRAGGAKAKPGMVASEVQQIADTIRRYFPEKSEPDVRFYMREKLNNAAKNVKRKIEKRL